ncbi:hypothetical protein SAMN04488060_0027 [Qipengyuania nanhaisediminis]|uniref:Uncharacterized protein n=2 Tax=Qipengyuania nanhaisediminis TaxID=604088 RepID=A0A1I5K9U3_9SPHN|nr:hypothetical protein SAMN04488060_0027 [Qipengyuania nanhaisediminis]
MLTEWIMKKARFAGIAIVAGVALTACEARDENAAPAADNEMPEAAQTSQVTRIDTDPAPAPAPQAIKTVPFARGSTMDITNIEIVGDIMTVEFRLTDREGNWTQNIDLDQVNYIEDQTSRMVSVLQNNDGQYVASPLTANGSSVRVQTRDGIGWFKFPRPAEGVTTISLSIPEAGSLNGLPVPST